MDEVFIDDANDRKGNKLNKIVAFFQSYDTATSIANQKIQKQTDKEAGASQRHEYHEIDLGRGVAGQDLQPELFSQLLKQQHYIHVIYYNKLIRF